nr:putative integrase/recombinase protein [Schizostauron trachyderma]
MSRQNTPTDNSVAERFMRTFKEHKINGKIIEQEIQESFLSGLRSYRAIINNYVRSLNRKPNYKTLTKSPEKHDNEVRTAALLMAEPVHHKAFSERFGSDKRRDDISNFKAQNNKVISILEQIAARKAEIVDRTPFDNFEDNLALELIDKRLMEMYELIQNNPIMIRQFVDDAIEPTNENVTEFRNEFHDEIETLNKKIDLLLPKVKRERQVQPLRDPVDNNLFPIFMASAGNASERRKDLIRSQLRVTYTILYHSGLRINEIRHFTQEDINTALEASQFNLIHHKTKQAHIHVLSKKAIKDLRDLTVEYNIIFEKYQFKYLFGKQKPITDKNLIKMVNKDLRHTSQKYHIPFNIRSHSFKINMITNLLKITSAQNTADIIGHSDIRSAMSYKRYALSKTEIQNLLNQIDNNNNNTKKD